MLINLTKHAIRIRLNDNPLCEADATDVVLSPSGMEANVTTIREQAPVLAFREGDADVMDVPVVNIRYGAILGLPEARAGVAYVVSALTAPLAWAQGRTDVYAPDTDPAGRAIRYPSDHKLKGLVFAVRDLAAYR